MTKSALAGPLAMLIAGCTTIRHPAQMPLGQWLIGTWLLIEPDLQFPLACASGLPITYEADGTYHMFGERGVWRLEGDRLHEGPTETDDADRSRVGVRHVNRIDRRGPDEMEKRFQNGGAETFRRCPPRR